MRRRKQPQPAENDAFNSPKETPRRFSGVEGEFLHPQPDAMATMHTDFLSVEAGH